MANSMSQMSMLQNAYHSLVQKAAIDELQGKTRTVSETGEEQASRLEVEDLARRYCQELDVDFKRKFASDVKFEVSRWRHKTEAINAVPAKRGYFGFFRSVKSTSWLIGLSVWLLIIGVCVGKFFPFASVSRIAAAAVVGVSAVVVVLFSLPLVAIAEQSRREKIERRYAVAQN